MHAINHHAAPNVVPGTNFNTQRFEELFAWISSLSADVARSAFAPNQYGLLLPFDGKQALQLEKIENLIILRRCAGITPAGHLIGVFGNITPTIEYRLEEDLMDAREQYYMLVEVDGKRRIPFGPETEDLPQRPQFSMPAYKLHVQPLNQPLGKWANAIPIGKLRNEAGEWCLGEYIPPTAQIGAQELLEEKYRSYKEAIYVMLNAQPNIIRQTDTFRDKAMIELREFTMQCGSYLATQKPVMEGLTLSGQPYKLFEIWLGFANLIDFLLNCLTDRPGFYDLLHQNTRSVNGIEYTTRRLSDTLGTLTEHQYDHTNMLQTINAIDELLTIIVPVFKALGKGTLRSRGLAHEGTYKETVKKPKKTFTTW